MSIWASITEKTLREKIYRIIALYSIKTTRNTILLINLNQFASI